MKIAICTLFRNSEQTIERTFKQRSLLSKKYNIVNICLEGDSVDNTYTLLDQRKDSDNVVLLKHDTGTPHYPSEIIPDRLITLGKLSNLLLDKALEIDPAYVVWMDSDISIPINYLDRLLSHNVSVVAPMFFFERSIYFRDTWGYRAKNEEFDNRYPYSKQYNQKILFEVDSVGLPVINMDVIKAGARFGAEEIVDFCRSIKKLGYPIYVDPLIAATHPRFPTLNIPASHER